MVRAQRPAPSAATTSSPSRSRSTRPRWCASSSARTGCAGVVHEDLGRRRGPHGDGGEAGGALAKGGAQAREHALAAPGARRRDLLAPRGGELPQQLVLLGAEVGGRRHQHVHEEVAAAAAAQVRHPEPAEPLDVAVLGARTDGQPLRAVERLDVRLGRPSAAWATLDGQGGVEVVALALEARVAG